MTAEQIQALLETAFSAMTALPVRDDMERMHLADAEAWCNNVIRSLERYQERRMAR